MEKTQRCELCLQTEIESYCEKAGKDDIASWSEGTLKASHDLFLCGSCVEDVKIVGNSLTIIGGWDGKITLHVSDDLLRDEATGRPNEVKEEPVEEAESLPTPYSAPNLATGEMETPIVKERGNFDRKNETSFSIDEGTVSEKTENIFAVPSSRTLRCRNRRKDRSFSRDDSSQGAAFDDSPPENQRMDNEIFCCRVCGKTFSTKQRCQKHESTHSGVKPFQCESCGKSFRSKALLLDHGRIHSGEKPFKCAICGEAFTHRKSLSYHEQSRHDASYLTERPFQCETCGTGFRQKNHLVDHVRIHSGEKPYACQYCYKKFSRHNSKTKHERTHTGERPFKCDHCKKAFGSSSHLSTHMRTHTGEKPFNCETCGKAFSRKDNLKEHERIHSGELPFTCDGCGDKFTRRKLLTDHFSSCHAHLLNLLQQREKQQSATVDGNEQTIVLPQEQTPLTAPILQHQALLLHHTALVEQPQHHHVHVHQQLDATLQLQHIPLLEQNVQHQPEEAFQAIPNEHEQLILLQNAVEDAPATDLESSNIKVQVYSIL